MEPPREVCETRLLIFLNTCIHVVLLGSYQLKGKNDTCMWQCPTIEVRFQKMYGLSIVISIDSLIIIKIANVSKHHAGPPLVPLKISFSSHCSQLTWKFATLWLPPHFIICSLDFHVCNIDLWHIIQKWIFYIIFYDAIYHQLEDCKPGWCRSLTKSLSKSSFIQLGMVNTAKDNFLHMLSKIQLEIIIAALSRNFTGRISSLSCY